MDLWQLDITGSVFLADGTEAKVITGEDDHSRYCVIAKVVRRGTGPAVCQAFARRWPPMAVRTRCSATFNLGGAASELICRPALMIGVVRHLPVNGRQFTGRYKRPRPTEVLFDRICRKNGIEHLLIAIRHPTGKLERWHQTLQNECLAEPTYRPSSQPRRRWWTPFRVEYNIRRPHQSLEMATPGSRFRPVPEEERAVLPLWLPAQLRPVEDDMVAADPGCEGPGRGQGRSDVGRSTLTPPADPRDGPATAPSTVSADAVELERVVPASGNLMVRPQQFWLGPARAGQTVRFWIDTTTVHLSIDGVRIKTLPSRFSVVDLARLRHGDARPAGPPPAPPSPGLLETGVAVECDRTVNGCGLVALAGQWLPVGFPLAGQRVTQRLEDQLVHVVADGS